MRRDRPACVAGFGGYPALPAMLAAGRLKVPMLIHEQNGVLGRVNRRFAPRGRRGGLRHLADGGAGGRAGRCISATRCAAAVLDRQGATYIEPGDHPMGLLVIGGSQGAGLFGRVVPEALRLLAPELRARLRLSQQVRPEDMDRVRAAYEEMGLAAELRGFFDDVPERLAEATLVISRAGASSIADISVIGRPAILIPYPHADGRPPGGERRRAGFRRRRLHDPRGGVDGGGAGGAHRRDPLRPRGGERDGPRRAGARGARTRPNIWRRWSRTSPEKGAEA